MRQLSQSNPQEPYKLKDIVSSKLEEKLFWKALESLSLNLTSKFLLAGGMRNKLLFPDFAQKNILNDVDVEVIPNKDNLQEQIINSSIKNSFWITHIYYENDGYYLAVVHKKTGIKFDIFWPERSRETINLQIMDNKNTIHNMEVISPEEAFFRSIFDVYINIVRNGSIPDKYANLCKFLIKQYDEGGFDNEKLESIWNSGEKEVIYQFCIQKNQPNLQANTLDEYLENIRHYLNQSNSGNNINKKQKSIFPLGYKLYPEDIKDNKYFDLSIENRRDFYICLATMLILRIRLTIAKTFSSI
jgi:hypothetical protein